MEFCACIDFVIILWGNLRPLKWNPLLIEPPPPLGNILEKERGSDFSHKKGGDSSEKTRGVKCFHPD